MADQLESLTITGNWKEFTFHIATESDCSRIVEHIRDHFVTREPMYKYLSGGVWNSDLEADLTAEVRHLLKEKLTLYVTPRNSIQVIAINLVGDSRTSASIEEEPKSHVTQTINTLIDKIRSRVRPLFKSKYACPYYAEISITSVDNAYGGQGIATEMYRRMLQLLHSEAYPAVSTGFSHSGTQRIGEKLGFDVLYKFYLYDQVDEQGKKIFPDADKDEFVVHVVKPL